MKRDGINLRMTVAPDTFDPWDTDQAGFYLVDPMATASRTIQEYHVKVL